MPKLVIGTPGRLVDLLINNKIDTKANANDYVTKVEFNATVGDIESILNNVLNEL